MATSRRPSPFGLEPLSLDPDLMPPRSPGPLGSRDGADPEAFRLRGDSPGALGVRDAGDPEAGLLVPPLLPLDYYLDEAYLEFRDRALARQIKNAQAMGRPFVTAVPDEELEYVDDKNRKHRMRKAAARKCREMLAEARADLAKEQAQAKKGAASESKEPAAAEAKTAAVTQSTKTAAAESKSKGAAVGSAAAVERFGISSGYRDFKDDERIWKDAFRKYYKETYVDRYWCRGGEHSDDAVKLQAIYNSPRKAAPGFSNHSNGLAVDFWTLEGKHLYQAETGKKKSDLARINARWKETWFHKWLAKNAKRFDFYPIDSEAWHWEYHGSTKLDDEAVAGGDAPSKG